MNNCQNNSQTKQASLAEIPALVQAEVAKGTVPPAAAAPVSAKLTEMVDAQYKTGANASSLRQLVAQFLPTAMATTVTTAAPQASAAGKVFGTNTPAVIPPPSTGTTGVVASNGTAVTGADLQQYYNHAKPRTDNDEFAIALWLTSEAVDPQTQLTALGYAKQLHNDIILPVATYYKEQLYGDPQHPIRLGQILYGIVMPDEVRKYLRGGPTSRHILGQAVNFKILNVDTSRVIDDIRTGRIPNLSYGTIAHTTGVQITLPYYAATGQLVSRLHLWSNRGVNGHVGYNFPT